MVGSEELCYPRPIDSIGLLSINFLCLIWIYESFKQITLNKELRQVIRNQQHDDQLAMQMDIQMDVAPAAETFVKSYSQF